MKTEKLIARSFVAIGTSDASFTVAPHTLTGMILEIEKLEIN